MTQTPTEKLKAALEKPLDWLKFIAEHHDCRKTRIGAKDQVKAIEDALTAASEAQPDIAEKLAGCLEYFAEYHSYRPTNEEKRPAFMREVKKAKEALKAYEAQRGK